MTAFLCLLLRHGLAYCSCVAVAKSQLWQPKISFPRLLKHVSLYLRREASQRFPWLKQTRNQSKSSVDYLQKISQWTFRQDSISWISTKMIISDLEMLTQECKSYLPLSNINQSLRRAYMHTSGAFKHLIFSNPALKWIRAIWSSTKSLSRAFFFLNDTSQEKEAYWMIPVSNLQSEMNISHDNGSDISTYNKPILFSTWASIKKSSHKS